MCRLKILLLVIAISLLLVLQTVLAGIQIIEWFFAKVLSKMRVINGKNIQRLLAEGERITTKRGKNATSV